MRWRFLLGLPILLVLLGGACTELTPTPTPTPTPVLRLEPVALMERAIAAMDKVDSYYFKMDMKIKVSAEGFSIELPIGLVGDFQRPDKSQAKLTMNIFGEQLDIEVITIGDSLYGQDPGTGEWEELDLDEAIPFTNPDQFIGVNPSDIEDLVLVGEDTLDGIRVYHLTGNARPEVEGPFGEFKGTLKVDFWIGVDSFLIQQVAIEGDIEGDFLSGPLAGGELSATTALTATIGFSDFGKAVAIEAPEVPLISASMAKTEFANVEVATTAMMVDNGLSTIPNPVTEATVPCRVGTKDMSTFPDATSVAGSADKQTDPNGNSYTAQDKSGYLVYSHDIKADGSPTSTVNYLAKQTTTYCYTIESTGEVRQYTEDGQETSGVIKEKERPEPLPTIEARHIPTGQSYTAYSTTPPTSGPHWAQPARCGIHDEELPDEQIVHNLEHAHVVISHNLPDMVDVEKLKQVVERLPGLSEWGVMRPYSKIPEGSVAIMAWGVLDQFDGVNETRIRALFQTYAGNNFSPERFPC